MNIRPTLWLDWPESDDASPYDFTVWHGRIFVGFNYRRRIVTAPASIIHGGIAHGQFVYTKDERKRVKIEPPDLSLIASTNGRVRENPRNRNVLWKPQHEKRQVNWNPFREGVRIFRHDIIRGGIGITQIRTTPKGLIGDPEFERWLRRCGWVTVLPAGEFSGEPTFDKGRFRRHRGYFKNTWQISKDLFHDNRPSKTTGDSFLATWQYGEVGNASPAVNHKPGTDLSRQELDRIARPSDSVRTEQTFKLSDGSLYCFPLAVLPWNTHAKHIVWNWKKHWDADQARFDEENARRYRRRLDHSAKRYDDLLRWNGKAKCKFDETYAQASGREWDERLFGREPSGQLHDLGSVGYLDENREHWRPLPFRSMGLQPRPRIWDLHIEKSPVRDAEIRWVTSDQSLDWVVLPRTGEMWRKWVMIAWWLLWHQETIWPERLKPKPDDWSIRIEGEAHLSKRWRKWTAKIATPRPSKHSQVYSPKDILPDEILPLVLLAQGNLAARNRVIARFRPGAAAIAAEYKDPTDPEFADLINQAIVGTPSDNGNTTNGLLYAIEKYKQTKGAFPNIAMEAMRWAIVKYLEQQPQHTSLNLIAPINPDDEDGDTLQDMIIDEGPDVDDGDETRAIFL